MHVVGAGVSGLAAALTAARAGWTVRLYEASARPGGRCAGLDGEGGARLDNGTHVLLGANRRALAFLDAIEARGRWVEPEPDGLPLVDLADGHLRRVGLSPWSWARPDRRPAGLGLRDLLRATPLLLPRARHTVAEAVGGGPLLRQVIEPLTLAALNTAPAEASARRLGRVLRRLLTPGAGRLLVARHGLDADLIDPALRALERYDVRPALRRRLQALDVHGGGVRRLRFADLEVQPGPHDRVILALPPHALARLLPALPLPRHYEAIVNLHLPVAWAGPVRFVGVLGGQAQWILLRPGMLSVTVSAASALVETPADEITARLVPEIAAATAAVGLSLALDPARARIVKERRATPHQGIDAAPPPAICQARNLWLAGDWLSPLPATIEAAVATGVAATRGLGRPPAGAGIGPAGMARAS